MSAKGTDSGGYIVVETLFSFTMLIMVMVVITSLINIVAVQSRIHYAITQTAQELSMYAYVTTCLSEDEERYEGLDFGNGFEWVASAQSAIDDMSHGITEFANNIAAGITGFFIDDYAAQLMKSLAAAATDPDMAQLVMENAIVDVFAKYLCEDMSQASTQADAYLTRAGVYSPDGTMQGLNGIEFVASDGTASTMIDANYDTVITVAYKIQFNIFNVIPLPLFLDVEQTVKTQAWLGGIVQK